MSTACGDDPRVLGDLPPHVVAVVDAAAVGDKHADGCEVRHPRELALALDRLLGPQPELLRELLSVLGGQAGGALAALDFILEENDRGHGRG